jgi:hypothetical protein
MANSRTPIPHAMIAVSKALSTPRALETVVVDRVASH